MLTASAIALGLLWTARLPVDCAYVVDLLPAMPLFGVAAGISFPQIMSLAMSAARRRTPACSPG